MAICLRYLRTQHQTLGRHYFHFNYSTKNPTNKAVPLLWDYRESGSTAQEAVTVQLHSWGRGASGQLGGGIEEIRIYPAAVASLLLPPSFTLSSPIPGRLSVSESSAENENDVVKVGISCGLFHSALLVNGQLWIWGKGDGGRLGLGHEEPVFVPTLNSHLGSNLVKCVALGGVHSVVLNSLGQVFTWGYGGFGALGHSVYHRELLPRLVEGPWTEEIYHIATSGTHTAAITKSGELYIWGRDEGDGRLGLGPGRGPNEAGGLSIPSKVRALPMPVAAVSCGGFFTMALSKEGRLWNWGANSNYELGRGDKLGGWKPQPVPSLKDVRIVQIASGGYHSIALTDKGEVFTWGHGGHGQLGHSNIQNQKVPLRVEALANEKVTYVACGSSSSAAITDEGKLYMWGNAKDCQLGIPGLPEVQPSPVEVKFLTEDDGSMIEKVLSVAIGASHAMCLVTRSNS
ncbi:RCC1 domain-containing protein RUG3, mitochondrial isoform X3 [Coffea eugenioides]|uniref:RCC1 domain-containing protein RUG3, mitochondrial isoform X3 n=1 Tax=Coffea eugenioides TaxID=49369 RepID=UPI000F60FB3D|nr:RCC1 domain-containing protein RUG3, mitochondrial isoform X3 [Coffea eugenioides]